MRNQSSKEPVSSSTSSSSLTLSPSTISQASLSSSSCSSSSLHLPSPVLHPYHTRFSPLPPVAPNVVVSPSTHILSSALVNSSVPIQRNVVKQEKLSSISIPKSSRAANKRPGVGRAPGSVNFKSADVSRLLDIVQQVKPIGHDMWERVENMYNQHKDTTVSPRNHNCEYVDFVCSRV